MKVAQIAPVWERVPPEKYGGIELVVYLLTEELVRRGHKVTLFATGDSVTSGELSSVYDVPPPREFIGNPVPDLHHVGKAFLRAEEFDIIHNHAGYSGVTLANFVSTPALTTLHGIFTDINKPLFSAFKDSVYYNSISNAQRAGLPELNYVGTVYNGIDVESYPFSAIKKDFFIFISRMSPLKAPHLAVEVARKAGVKLILAGKIDPGNDMGYFKEKVEPLIDGKQIQYLGEVTEEEKRELFKDAKALVFPLQWNEPFGLIMAEANICGTPVLAFPYGSLPEVVADGKTGFLVNTIDEMVQAINRLDEIDPYECRRHAEENFSVAKMVDNYERHYKNIVKMGKPKPRPT